CDGCVNSACRSSKRIPILSPACYLYHLSAPSGTPRCPPDTENVVIGPASATRPGPQGDLENHPGVAVPCPSGAVATPTPPPPAPTCPCPGCVLFALLAKRTRRPHSGQVMCFCNVAFTPLGGVGGQVHERLAQASRGCGNSLSLPAAVPLDRWLRPPELYRGTR